MGNKIGQMDLSSCINDNIDDVLVKIIEFTHFRHSIIENNLKGCRCGDFVPLRLDVEDFTRVISVALAGHQKSGKLLLCDSETVSFGIGGALEIKPVVDVSAGRLFKENFQQYLSMQNKRLSENAINNKTACALLSFKKKRSKITA